MANPSSNQSQDDEASESGKVDNDRNKLGNKAPTQKNEGRRSPASRSDREGKIGNNQSHMRQGGPNQGDKAPPRGGQR